MSGSERRPTDLADRERPESANFSDVRNRGAGGRAAYGGSCQAGPAEMGGKRKFRAGKQNARITRREWTRRRTGKGAERPVAPLSSARSLPPERWVPAAGLGDQDALFDR